MPTSKIILHVEDNPENRLLIRRILQAYGFQILEAENASQTRQILETVQPDLILMDINMPDVDGYTLTHELRSRPALEKTPILAITANVMKGDRERSLSAGCDGYIEKPIDIDRFMEQIEHFVQA